MKIRIALATVALTLAAAGSAAAQDGAAAATLPNPFDPATPRAAAPRPTPTPAAPVAPTTVARDERTEPALRAVIDSARAGGLDYSVFAADAGAKMRAAEGMMRSLIDGKGEIVAVLFQGQQDGADVYRVVFESGADTQWAIGIGDDDKIGFFLFREATD